MADNEIIERIDTAVGRLCDSLHAIYTNFFDRNALQDVHSQVINPRRVIPIGTYACGVWEAGEDVHLVCISSNTAETFWSYLKENLCLDVDAKMPSKDELATIELSATRFSRKTDSFKCCLNDFAELSHLGKASCRFYLHYAEAQKTVLDRILRDTIPFPSAQSHSPPSVFNAIIVRDIQMVALESEASRPKFIQLLQQLRQWALSNGLIGAKLGFLDSNDFVWLASGTLFTNASAEADDPLESNTPLEAAFDRLVSHMRLQPGSGHLEAPKLLGQTINEGRITRNLSIEAREAIVKADPRSKSSKPSANEEPNHSLLRFIDSLDYFLKVECECWTPMLDTRANFQENVVPCNIKKLVETLRDENQSFRIWPRAVVHSPNQTRQVYVIGLICSVDLAVDFNQIEQILSYDPSIGLIQITVATQKDLRSLIAETEAEQVGTTNNDLDESITVTTPIGIPKPTKFRTAHDAVSRLKYDPKHMGERYEVGYVDRFEAELMWMPLEEWGGKAVEDENFVPEHRIRQLRHSKDKGVVWDRENRVDLT